MYKIYLLIFSSFLALAGAAFADDHPMRFSSQSSCAREIDVCYFVGDEAGHVYKAPYTEYTAQLQIDSPGAEIVKNSEGLRYLRAFANARSLLMFHGQLFALTKDDLVVFWDSSNQRWVYVKAQPIAKLQTDDYQLFAIDRNGNLGSFDGNEEILYTTTSLFHTQMLNVWNSAENIFTQRATNVDTMLKTNVTLVRYLNGQSENFYARYGR